MSRFHKYSKRIRGAKNKSQHLNWYELSPNKYWVTNNKDGTNNKYEPPFWPLPECQCKPNCWFRASTPIQPEQCATIIINEANIQLAINEANVQLDLSDKRLKL